MYYIVFERQALKDIKLLKQANLTEKAKGLVNVLRENPFQNPPRYEALVGNLQGLFSRRISFQHRMVYQVFEGKVKYEKVQYDGVMKIIRLWTHYDKI